MVVVDGFGEFGAAAVHSRREQLHRRAADAAVHRRLWNKPSYAGQSLLAQALEKAIHIS